MLLWSFSINTSDPVPLASINAHTIRWWYVSVHEHPYSSLFILIIVSSIHRLLFESCTDFFGNSNLAYLFLRLTVDFHLVVNPLYVLYSAEAFSCLLTDTDTPTSWREYFIWPTVVKVFFASKRILPTPTTVAFCGVPGLTVVLSSPVHSIFLRMHQIVRFDHA